MKLSIPCLFLTVLGLAFATWETPAIQLRLVKYVNQAALSYQVIKSQTNLILPNLKECKELLTRDHAENLDMMNLKEINSKDCGYLDKSNIEGYFLTILGKESGKLCLFKFRSVSVKLEPTTLLHKYSFEDDAWLEVPDLPKNSLIHNLVDPNFEHPKVPYCNVVPDNPTGKFCFPKLVADTSFISELKRIPCKTKLHPVTEGSTGTVTQLMTHKNPEPIGISVVNNLEYNPCKFDKDCISELIPAHVYEVTVLKREKGVDKEVSFLSNSLNVGLYNDPKNLNNYFCTNNSHVSLTQNRKSDEMEDYLKTNVLSGKDKEKLVSFDISSSCFSGLCDGDETYCRSIGCVKKSKPYCKFMPQSHELIVHTKSSDVKPVRVRTLLSHISIEKDTTGHRLTVDCSSCKLTCEKGELSIDTRQNDFTNVEICKFPLCLRKNLTNTNVLNLKLPRAMLVHSGEVKLKIKFNKNDFPIAIKTYCEGIDICSYYTGFFTYDHWIHPSCYTFGQYSVLIFLSVLILICAYPILYIFCKILGFLIIYLKPFIIYSWKTYKYLMNSLMGCCRNMKQRHDERLEEITVVPVTKRRTLENQELSLKTKQLLGISILFLLFCSTQGCDKSVTMTVTQDQCTVDDTGLETCNIITSSRLALSPVGQTSCFVLFKNKKPMGSLQIRTNSIQLSCIKNSLYYIPHVRSECSSAYNCQGAGYCSNDFRECNHPEQFTDKIFQSHSKLSWHECRILPAIPSCWNSRACMHIQKKLVMRSKNSAAVYDCSSWRYSADVKVSIVHIGDVQSKSMQLIVGASQAFDFVTLNLVSISSPPSILFNNCFMNRGKLWTSIPCNKRGEYAVGRIGEIQCPTAASAESQNFDGCIADSSLIEIHERNTYVDCSDKFLSIPDYMKSLLPMKVGDYDISIDEDIPVARLKEAALLEVQIDVSGLQVQSSSDHSSCFVKFLSIKGCYSCPQGSIISLEVNTNFGSATGMVICPKEHINFPVLVQSTIGLVNTTVHFSKPVLDEECYLECPAGKKDFKITGELHYVPNNDLHSNETNSGTVLDVGGIDWGGLFKLPTFRLFSMILSLFFTLILIYIIIKLTLAVIKVKKN